MNYTTEDSMLMNDMDRMPWRGAREKDARLLRHIIEGTTDEGDVVLDCTASTGEFQVNMCIFHVYVVLKMIFGADFISVFFRCLYYGMSCDRATHFGIGGR
jgi:hypothetical protein